MQKYTKEELFKLTATEVYELVLRGDIIKKFPDGFWKMEESESHACECVKHLIENILYYDMDDIKNKISLSLFKKNKLSGMMQYCFDNSPYKAINSAYPGKFKEWELKNAPSGYWNNKENGVKATKWLIEEKLNLSDDEIVEKISTSFFKENGLGGMLDICFNSSPYEAIDSAYPNKFKVWEFNNVPNRYWNEKENGIKATKWLIEEKLNLNENQVKEQLTSNLFKKYKLGGMLQYSFNSSPYEAINSSYPGKFKEWEFRATSAGYWNKKENSIRAIKWMVEEKLNISDDELKEKLSFKLFKSHGLGGMLQKAFNSSPFEAINLAYPNKFKEWEFKCVPMRYWDKKRGIEATKWLIEEKLNLNELEIKELVSLKLFKENGLGGMIDYVFNGSPYDAINSTYPGKYKPWEFKNVPIGYWKDEKNYNNAMKWLIEDKLMMSDDDVKNMLSTKLFKDNGLIGMLQHCFNSSPYEAINSAYPNKFKQWELNCTSYKYWDNKEKGIEAVKWLIEEKLNLSDEEIKEKVCIKLFKDYKLGSMLKYCFNNDVYDAIRSTYGDKFLKKDFKKI